MNTMRRSRWWGLVALVLMLAPLAGCQTWTSGMTLPSGRYLEHPPQFFQPRPPFPLTTELAHMEEAQAAGPAVPGAPAPLPPPVPGAGAGGP